MHDWTGTGGKPFVHRSAHRQWLISESFSLLRLWHRSALNTEGGFHTLDSQGRPNPPAASDGDVRQLHDTTRMVHCFSIAHLLGWPGADQFVDHGMHFLRTRHRDAGHGGYFWAVNNAQPTDSSKQAYGHAFVILAASSAHRVGHPDAIALLEDAVSVLFERFWDDSVGATSEEYTADWQSLGDYRGQNSNMHLTEALMAAFEASGDEQYLRMAERIAELIINRHARAEGWRVPEHYNSDWTVDRAYAGDPMFRPSGTTPGHALEWSRLLVQLWEAGQRERDWLLEAAISLFDRAVETAWDAQSGGFYYTLDWSDRPNQSDRYWWPCAEGIGAAAVLSLATRGEPRFELWYRRIWGFVNNHLIDHVHGGWFPELNDRLQCKSTVFSGKPDLYHALQACLIPLLPGTGSITHQLLESDLRLTCSNERAMRSARHV